MTWQGKSALVTGASRGLGAELGKALARAGAKVVLVARDEAPLAATVEAIRATGGEAHALSADVGDKYAIHRLSGAAAALVGPIDLLVHNASSLGPTPLRSLLDTECEDLERVLAVNLVGPFRLTRALAGSMLLRGGGTLLHISSDAAVNAYQNWGAYSVSKAALDTLARGFAAELAEFGVRSLSVDPGEMDTQMHADAIPDADRSTLADPAAVAGRILAILSDPSVPNGARVEAQSYRGAS